MALICVPVAGETPEILFERIKSAVRAAPDLIEIRVDYLEDMNVEFSDIVSKTSIPLILTVRKKDEGGLFRYGEKKRIEILEKCIEAKPCFVDLELNMNSSNLGRLLDLAKQNSVSVILSFHSFENTPSKEVLLQKINEAVQKGGELVKLVTFARDITDNLVTLSLPQEANTLGIKVISFCMGEKGIISRVLCPLFGSYLTYASLDISTAPGQISLDTMREIHTLFFSLMEKKV